MKTFFWSSLDFGQVNGLILDAENFHSAMVFVILKFSEFPGPLPPSFENPAYATDCTTLSRTHFEWANATFVAEHNIISAIVFCIQKVASEANRAFTNICDLKCWQPKDYKLLGKSILFGIISLIATHLRSSTTIERFSNKLSGMR